MDLDPDPPKQEEKQANAASLPFDELQSETMALLDAARAHAMRFSFNPSWEALMEEIARLEAFYETIVEPQMPKHVFVIFTLYQNYIFVRRKLPLPGESKPEDKPNATAQPA
jgi:hypothetical protein